MSVVDGSAAAAPPGVQVPWRSLSPTTLRAVIEEFITREGTEYGEHDMPLDHKVDAVMAQLKHGSVAIFFDNETETVTLQAGRHPRAAAAGPQGRARRL